MWMKYILMKDAIKKAAKNIDFIVPLVLTDYIPYPDSAQLLNYYLQIYYI